MRPLQLGQALDFRNRFAFPAGRKAGFDPNHFVCSGLTNFFSAVPVGDSYQDMVTGQFGTPINNNIRSTINAVIGPAPSNFNTAFTWVTFTGKPAVSFASETFGIIFSTLTSSTSWLFSNSDSGNAGDTPVVQPNGANEVSLNRWASNNDNYNSGTFSSFLTVNTPFLLILTNSSVLDSSICYLVNLLTGQVVSDTAGYAATNGASNGHYVIGTSPNTGLYAQGQVAAVMYAEGYLSQSAALKWASDPWSFWYPRREQAFVGISAPPPSSFKPYWAYRSNITIN